MTAPRSDGKVADAVRGVVAPVIAAADLWLEDVSVSRAGSRTLVRIIVDLPETEIGSLDSDVLGEVSRSVSAALDADDVVPGAYLLEVSTPGITRALTEPRHFRRARTRLVKLNLADGSEATGRLTDVVERDGQ
ncbi:MAG: ribosome maturation factor RimP, partial [Promicromonosporaceae bacterium]|nr:ribosome maturation factor RimP [Promicromonosporaceae bacterium]